MIHRTSISPFLITNRTLHRDYHPCMLILGFEFDSKMNDYKVVKIFYPGSGKVPFVELYSINKGAWLIIDSFSIVDVKIVECVWSRCFFTWKCALAYFQYCVLIFDVEEENFKKIRLPPELSILHLHDYLTIFVINGCLSVIHYEYLHERETTTVFNIWKKREHELWNKIYAVNLQTRVDQRVLLALRTRDGIF